MQMQLATTLLSFAQCASIMEHKLRSACGKGFDIEVVQRRCEKGFFLRSRGRPDMQTPLSLAYSLRQLPAWKGVKIQVGVFFEGFADATPYESVKEWMMTQTEIDRYMWTLEGVDLFIRPRSKHKDTFNETMIAEMERLACELERKDRAIMAVYVEIQVPYS